MFLAERRTRRRPARRALAIEGFELEKLFTRIANIVAHLAGLPLTFVGCCAIVVVWAVSGPFFGFSDTWQLVINTGTTIITFLMVFLIQNAQNRDASAIQVKLDELIRAVDLARNEFIGIEHLTDAEICQIRDRLEDDERQAELLDERQQGLSRLLERR